MMWEKIEEGKKCDVVPALSGRSAVSLQLERFGFFFLMDEKTYSHYTYLKRTII